MSKTPDQLQLNLLRAASLNQLLGFHQGDNIATHGPSSPVCLAVAVLDGDSRY